VHRVVSPGLRADMRTSMVNLSDLILAEGPGR
jgi:hypothetical protein